MKKHQVPPKNDQVITEEKQARILQLQAENKALQERLERFEVMIARIEKALFGNGGDGALAQLAEVLGQIYNQNKELVAQNRALASKLRLENVMLDILRAAQVRSMAEAVAAQEAA